MGENFLRGAKFAKMGKIPTARREDGETAPFVKINSLFSSHELYMYKQIERLFAFQHINMYNKSISSLQHDNHSA